ncbi:MAG: hypothetical protein JW724_04450 [Candidatus Altiarchaeota archaeon]|nr:hypothetical protein [Candidatus Altiarchaeota archaeon]
MSINPWTITTLLLCIAVSAGSSALSCEDDFSGVKADYGKWNYYPVKCISGEDSLTAAYFGNLSDNIDVIISKKPDDVYIIGLLVDARDAREGRYAGRVEIYDEYGDTLASLSSRVRITSDDDEDLWISKTRVNFEFDRLNREECYTVEIRNEGNVDLDDLEAELKTWSSVNDDWITISDIVDDVFNIGEEEELEICVRNGNDTGRREGLITVRTEQVSEEITVSLEFDLGDIDTEYMKKYKDLLEQHMFLEKAYSQARAYRTLWEEINGTQIVEELDMLNKSYENLTKRHGQLLAEYEELKRNASGEGNATFTQAAEKELDKLKTSLAESAKEADTLKKKTEELAAQIEEKDALMALMNLPGKNETSTNAAIANAVLIPPAYAPCLAPLAAALAVSVIAGAFLLRRRRQSSKAAQKQGKAAAPTTLAKPAVVAAPASGKQKLDDEQREALKKLLMQKLAEKAAERK